MSELTFYVVNSNYVMEDARCYNVNRVHKHNNRSYVDGDIYRTKEEAQRVCDESNLSVYKCELEHHLNECEYYKRRIKEIEERQKKGEWVE